MLPRIHPTLTPAYHPAGVDPTLLQTALNALERNDFAAVEQLWRSAPSTARAHPSLQLLRALALGGGGELRRAEKLLDRLATPGHAHPRRNLGDLLARLGRHGPAAIQYRAAVAALPDDTQAWHALGRSLTESGDLADAEAAFRRATTLAPEAAAPWSNLGMVLKIQTRFDEAVAAHNQAVARAPHDPQIRVNRAVALLHAGRLTEAWADYEYRLRLDGRPRLPPGPLLPDITSLDLRGRTVLVWHEEGFGDTIQFARYIPLLAASGARVFLAVPNPLVRLMQTLGSATILGPADPFPTYDYHCPVFSLPRAFGTKLDTIPSDVSYLFAEQELAAAWATRLPEAHYRVGAVWAGQARPWLPGFESLNARRSLDPGELRPLAELPGIRLISLQLGQAAPDFMFDPTGQITDFADTAGIIANLDAVVSVDTSVVHLAGALGKPVLLLDRFDNYWRWFSGREDSPWYPTLRIFRQDRTGDWSGPLRRAARWLRDSPRLALGATVADCPGRECIRDSLTSR
jgi:tetratricopeptide (TPR) repeat protein